MSATEYKVIATQDFIRTATSNPGQRVRISVLNETDAAKHLNGILGTIPPRSAEDKIAYHYHNARESIIQILSGDAIEMIEGKAVHLNPGDVIFIPPNVKHTLLNNSSTQELKYMEFYSPTVPDSVQIND